MGGGDPFGENSMQMITILEPSPNRFKYYKYEKKANRTISAWDKYFQLRRTITIHLMLAN